MLGGSANGVPVGGHIPAHGHALHMYQQAQPRDRWNQVPSHSQPQPQPQPWQQSQPIQHPAAPSPAPQMQAQGYQQYYQNNNVAPFDLSSVVSQQIMQDFFRLSTPVGTSPNDDAILAQALYESRQTGKTYRQALEGLHSVNNHAVNLWKDYYLDHHDRIEVLVSHLATQPKTVKKPFTSGKLPTQAKEEGTSHQVARKRQHSPPPPTPSPPCQIPKKKGRPSASSQASRRKRATPQLVASALNRPPKRPRATLNSLSAPLPSSDVPNLMPPQVHIPIPDPPSRSPSPPAVVQVGTNGNKYTKEDREYFIKFLTWRLKQDPSLTKKEICKQLHEKAPHHSINSWVSHWHQRHDIADKIFATYYNRSEGGANDDDQLDEEEEGEVEAEIDDDGDAQSETMSASETGQRGRHRSEGTFSDFGDPNVDTEEDEDDMGEHGSAFTRGDWCTLARFIARNHWDEMLPKERWQTFAENHGTKRTSKSWGEFYRKNEAAILRLSEKYSPSKGNKRWRGHLSRRSKREPSQEPSTDEDGEYETDNEN